jgi:hypothetical protein
VLPTALLCEVRTFLGVLRQRGDPGDSSVAKDTSLFRIQESGKQLEIFQSEVTAVQ